MGTITPGRVLLTINSLAAIVGPFAADWSVTHVFNPRWPPHAKFHNGQTMSTGLALGLLTLYYTWRSPLNIVGAIPASLGNPLLRNVMAARVALDGVTTAALFGGLYWVTGLSAALYPGAKAMDPEFGEGHAQLYLFASLLGITGVGWFLERSRLLSVLATVK